MLASKETIQIVSKNHCTSFFLKTLKLIFLDLAGEKKLIKSSSDIPSKLKVEAAKLEEKKLFLFRKSYYFLAKDCESKASFEDIDMFMNCEFESLEEFQKNLQK